MNPFVEQPPDAVRASAKAFTQRDPRTHWSIFAALLGAVEDRQLYAEYGFRSTRAWAEHDLELSPGDCLELLRLYRMIQLAEHPLEVWAKVGRGKARIVLRALHLGGGPAVWLNHALSSATEDALRALLQRQTGEDVFVPFTVWIPESEVPLIREAFRKALRAAVGDEARIPDEPEAQEAMAVERANAFRCLEIICAEFVT